MNNLRKYTTVYPVHDDICEEILGTLVSAKTKKYWLHNSPSLPYTDY